MSSDLVYVVKQGDDNEELRYSLRSLRNLEHGTVWIVGYKPPWVTGVGHLPTRQDRSKYENSTANLLAAATHPEVSEDFVLMNDDFFVVKPVDQVPVLHRGPVVRVEHHYYEKYKDQMPGDYRLGMTQTKYLLERWGHADPLSYEVHVPMPLEKAKVVEVLKRAFDTEKIRALHKRTLYGNVWDLGGTEIADTKVLSNGFWHPNGLPFVSTNDSSFKIGSIGVSLRKRFPDPSPYERTSE